MWVNRFKTEVYSPIKQRIRITQPAASETLIVHPSVEKRRENSPKTEKTEQKRTSRRKVGFGQAHREMWHLPPISVNLPVTFTV